MEHSLHNEFTAVSLLMVKSYLNIFILVLEAIKTQKKLKTGTRSLFETQ